MSNIGPSFAAELDQAGITDRRFTWGGDGVIQYAPDFPDDERAKVEAVLKAHDGPLSEARQQALEDLGAETRRRIAEMFLRPPQTFDLVFAEINAVARAVQILKRGGSALPEERLALETLDGVYDRVQAIRDAQGNAKAALQAAKSVEEVHAVKAEWPKE